MTPKFSSFRRVPFRALRRVTGTGERRPAPEAHRRLASRGEGSARPEVMMRPAIRSAPPSGSTSTNQMDLLAETELRDERAREREAAERALHLAGEKTT